MALARPAADPVEDKPDVVAFVRGLSLEAIPDEVRRQARRLLLDLIGVAAAGRAVRSAQIVCDFAAAHTAAGAHGARMPFDSRRVSVPGAAMAGAASIEALEAHDDHRLAKGHPGPSILPALLAVSDEMALASGAELLVRFVVGYEIAIRAGLALHETASEAHGSGAWGAVGAAALSARALGLDPEEVRHAVGAAEYFAPQSQVMRCVDFPSMVRHGAIFGAHAGVSAALLAAGGLAGAPALTVEDNLVDEAWSDLGRRWLMAAPTVRAWPVCRWALPAVEAAAHIREAIGNRPIDRLIVETFHEATRLSTSQPQTTEAAQFSLPFAVAAMIVHGRIDARIVTQGLDDPAVLQLSERVQLAVSPSLNSAFPGRRAARIIAILTNGEVVDTPSMEAHGEPERPLSDTELVNKFLSYATPVTGRLRALAIAEMVSRLERLTEARQLLDLVAAPPQGVAG